jgi:hypothetical protein
MVNPNPTLNEEMRSEKTYKKIGELYSKGISWQGIADILEREDGIKTTPAFVSKVFEDFQVRSHEVMHQDEDVKKMAKDLILDNISQLKAINDLTWGILKKQSTADEVKLSGVNQILNQLKYNDDRIAKFEKFFDTNKMSLLEQARLMEKWLKGLEEAGYIKIISMPGQSFDLAKAEEKEIKEAEVVKETIKKKAADEEEDIPFSEEDGDYNVENTQI